LDARGSETVTRQRRVAALAALLGASALTGWVAAGLAGFGSLGVDNTDAAAIADREATRGAMSVNADAAPAAPVEAAPAAAKVSVAAVGPLYIELPQPAVAPAAVSRNHAPAAAPAPAAPAAAPAAASANAARPDPEPPVSIVAPAAVPVGEAAATTDADRPVVSADASAAEVSVGEAPSPDSPPTPPPERRVKLVSLFTPDPGKEEYPKPAVRPVETPNECLVAEICIDDYLWSLYERTPKVDTNKVVERIKVTVKKKGKTRTVTKTNTKYVVGDFTWKDPIAAQRAGMSLRDYVIGGMDRKFKLKLYYALRKIDEAGHMPGITSAFRDDYRQAIASGNKAASDSSFHGGSRRGGYGHGLAADVVSLKGETRMQRYVSSDEMWKWIDAREKELGIGRPYLNRDPPHVGPIDGREFVAKRGGANVRKAAQKSAPQAKNAQKAASQTKSAQKAGVQTKDARRAETKKGRLAARNDSSAAKRVKPAKSSKVSSLQSRANVQR
jgi:hypothetical protein